MAEQISYINVRPVWRRALLIVPAALALWGAWYGTLWGMGRTMAEFTPDLKTAEAAVRVAPGDPYAHLKLARVNFRTLLPERTVEAMREYELAASLAPNDYLVWLEMGRVRESAGDAEGGERALRRATELAPNYALPRWYLGNLLLRAGRDREAFEELSRAGDADPALRPQVFNFAWRIYEGDIPRVLEAVGRSPQARAQLATYLLYHQRLDEAVQLWKSLSADERHEQQAAGQQITAAFFDARRFRTALELYREQATAEGAPVPTAGKVLNGGFEEDIGPSSPYIFGWRVVPAPPTQIAIDPRAGRSGARSLRISFSSVASFDHKNVAQLVVVEPGARYRLTYSVRSDGLQSASTLLVDVVDAGESGTVLAQSPPLAIGTNDWQQQVVEFSAPPRSEAVFVRLNRAPCMSAAGCPIFGKVWYDDFNLERIGAAVAR
ncbi:MAG TPA: tetratricopeptide repeat protein [Pyrinomonadaceae bacterium]|nr:tetratricopeptide repeat protein [Pyrinomonadaceae bacterium]